MNLRRTPRRMEIRTGISLTVTLLLAALPMAAAADVTRAEARTETQPFAGGVTRLPEGCGDEGHGGGPKFEVPPVVFETFEGEGSVQLTMRDVDPTAPVKAFVNQTGRWRDGPVVCWKTKRPLPIEGGTPVYLFIFQSSGPLCCQGGAGGVIEATFYPVGESPEIPVIERQVGLSAEGHLRLEGRISAIEPQCFDRVDVRIQKKTSSGWTTLHTTSAAPDGSFAVSVEDQGGRYRAVAPRLIEWELTCARAKSQTLGHRH